jgi:hypothetical protein
VEKEREVRGWLRFRGKEESYLELADGVIEVLLLEVDI